MLIRGYFSAKTHPLLAPLVPRMKDLLNEFEVAGAGQVRVEIIRLAISRAISRACSRSTPSCASPCATIGRSC
mgnify:CR=1 FL=1